MIQTPNPQQQMTYFNTTNEEVGCVCIPMKQHTFAVREKSAYFETKQGGCFGLLPKCCCTDTSSSIVPFSAIQTVDTSYGGFKDTVCCMSMNRIVVRTNGFTRMATINGNKETATAIDAIQAIMSNPGNSGVYPVVAKTSTY
jgi:hypothetical protein